MYFPVNKITINLAPADVKKEGSHYDLPLAVSILKASDQLSADTDGIVFLGELALDGALRPVTGIMPVLISAKTKGFKRFIIPYANANEASYLEGTEVYALKTLREVVDFLKGEITVSPVAHRDFVAARRTQSYNYDMSLVRGQKVAKRAIEIAVAGGHNILLAGPPGTGKTLLARCIPTIMPDMTFEEALEVTKIHSVAGELSEEGIVSLRPFRTPHHTATTVSLCGGGNSKIHAGEISKAHKGVLFFGRTSRIFAAHAGIFASAARGQGNYRCARGRRGDLPRGLHTLRKHESLPVRKLRLVLSHVYMHPRADT